MTTHANNEEEMGRRGFLKALALTAVAATTVGGGAGYLSNRVRDSAVTTTTVSPVAPRAVTVAETAATANHELADLLAQLASAQAENMRLRADLDATQRRLGALESANGDAGAMNDTLRQELATATQDASVLAGLVALYEQLDDGQLLDTVEGRLAQFGQSLGGLLAEIPTVEEGLALGAAALNDFEARVPGLDEGRRWLESHLARLDAFYAAAEAILENVAESAGTFLQKLEEWFAGVRKWLPFGVGDRAAQVMASLTALLDETPRTIHGLRRNVADPLDGWVGKETEEAPVRASLIRPLRETTLQRTGAVIERARATGSTFESELQAPLQEAISSRRRLREQIAAYRIEHNL